MKANYKGKNILAIDLEFAQNYKKSKKKAAIMEIGMILVEDLGNEESITEYDKMFNPGVGVNFYVTKVTGITKSMLKGLPPIEEYKDEIQSIIDKADVLVFHGGAPDIEALRITGFDLRNKKLIDTQDLARGSTYDFEGYSLPHLADFLDIDLSCSHRALEDARTTLALYRKLVC